MSLKKLEFLFDKLELNIQSKLVEDNYNLKKAYEEIISNLQAHNKQLISQLEKKEEELSLLNNNFLVVFNQLKVIIDEISNMIQE